MAGRTITPRRGASLRRLTAHQKDSLLAMSGRIIRPSRPGAEQARRRPRSVSGAAVVTARSESAHVFSLGALGALGDIELDGLVLIQGLVTLGLDG